MLTIQYLLESAFCLAALYALYWYTLRQETFFQWNRAYLLLAPVLAFVIPALHIGIAPAAPQAPAPTAADAAPAAAFNLPVLIEQVQVVPQAVKQTLEQPLWSVTLGEVLWWIYLTVAWCFLLHLAWQLYRMLIFLKRCQRSKQSGVVLTTGPANTPLASFFGFVFWHPGDATTAEQQLLFEHEMVHVRQWHSLDLVLMQLLIALQWFNPLLYAYRRSLRTVHEYIADENVVRRTRQRQSYARLLVNRLATGNGAQPGLVNTFHSLIKTRLIMLAKHPSSPARRAKYLLALPLFGALLLLFSFRLVEHLPLAKPLRTALQTAEDYAARLSTVTITAPVISAAEPTPFIFYWGSLNGKFLSENNSELCFLELETSPEEFREALKREPRLWNGHSLEQHLAFSCNGIAVRSDYQNESVYDNQRKALETLAADLSDNSSLELKNIELPEGKTGTVRITFQQKAPNWLPRQSSELYYQTDPGRELDDFLNMDWGRLGNNRQFFTEAEFWAQIAATPNLYQHGEFPELANFPQADVTRKAGADDVVPERFMLRIIGAGGILVHPYNTAVEPSLSIDPATKKLFPALPVQSSYSLEELRQQLDANRSYIKPGAVIWITGLKDALASGSDQQTRSGSSVFQLVAPTDPRLFLTRRERNDYFFEWGNLSTKFMSMYACSYRDNTNQRFYADQPKTQINTGLTKKDILQMLRLPARLYREKELLTDISFTLDYNGYGALIEKGNVPAELIEKLERELQPGDVLKITGFHAQTDGPRQVILPTEQYFQNVEKLSAAPGIKYLQQKFFGTTKLLRMAISTKETEEWRKVFNDMPGVYFQNGDVDLSTMTYELEVRSDDPKPPLRPTTTQATDAGIVLNISPNPAQDQATLDIQLPQAGPGVLTVADAAGVVKFSLKTDFQAGKTPFRLPLAAIKSKGMLVVRLELPYGAASTKLLVE